MRILQLIDSLQVGGAERMAVNYANALADENRIFSFGGFKKRRCFKKSHQRKSELFFALTSNRLSM